MTNDMKMTWEEYENEVFELSKIYYPDAKVEKNVKKKGKFSKVKRQIDVLVEQSIGGNLNTIVIDCKLYNKKVDVKSVEAFISMVEDLGADKGLLITEKGYSKAALNRAYYNSKHIELDILSLENLKSHLHSDFAFPFAGQNGILLFAPFGWIVDAKKRSGFVCMLYQRGLTLEEAATRKEVAYLNFWNKRKNNLDLESLLKYQERYMYNEKEVLSIEYINTISITNNQSKIRIMKVKNYPSIEVTGFIEFDDFILFIVWFSLETSLKRTISKIDILLKNVIPINVDQSSILKSDIQALDLLLDQTQDDDTKANIYISQAEILSGYGEYDSAITKLDKSIGLVKNNYGAIRNKMDLYLTLNKPTEDINIIINQFCEIDPTNPIICNDIIQIFLEHGKEKMLASILKEKALYYEENRKANGNFVFHIGKMYLYILDKNKAKEYFIQAKSIFSNILKKDDSLFKVIDNAIKLCKK